MSAKYHLAAAASIAALSIHQSASAQETLEEVIVTANRREERLQDVPTSITAVSGEKLISTGFQNPSDLQYLAPSLSFNTNAAGNQFQIRGVGATSVDAALERPVAVFLDEVVQGVPRDPGFNAFADVERIEVLRGPQGTLFGKNASAGVVSIITRRPTFLETEAIGHFRYGTDNDLYAEGTLNVPLRDNLATRVTGVLKQRDGWLRDVLRDGQSDGYKDQGVRAKLLWQASDNLSVHLMGDYQDHRDAESVIYTIRKNAPFTGSPSTQDLGTILAGYGITPGPENESYAVNIEPSSKSSSKSATGTVTYSFGEYTLTSITGYKDVDAAIAIDGDQSPTNFLDVNRVDTQGEQFSEEVRINSPVGSFFDYVAGLYYYDLNTKQQEYVGGTLGRNPPPNTLYNTTGGVNNYDIDSRSYAAFGQGNLHFTDMLTAVIGLRYTHDDSRSHFFLTPDAQYNLVPLGAPTPEAEGKTSADDLSGRASLQFKPNDDLMFYATAARGYKGPAVGTVRGNVKAIEPETVWNYEVGFKTQFFDRALTLNTSVFTQKFQDFQTTTVDRDPNGQYVFILANAGGMRSNGVESDVHLRVSSNLSLYASAAYVESKFTEYLGGCYPRQTLRPDPGPGCYIIPGTTTRVYDLSGHRTPFAPWLTANGGFDVSQPVASNLTLFVNANYSYRSRFESNTGDPNTTVSGYGLLNANVGLGPEDGRWRIGVYARNLLDTNFPARILTLSAAPAGLLAQQTAADARRTIGVKLDFAF